MNNKMSSYLHPHPPNRGAPKHGKLRIGGFDLLMQELNRNSDNDSSSQQPASARNRSPRSFLAPGASNRAIPSTGRIPLKDIGNQPKVPIPPSDKLPAPKKGFESARAVRELREADMERQQQLIQEHHKEMQLMKEREEATRYNPGMTPTEALSKHQSRLTPYEQREILNFERVYCVGENARKIHARPNEPGPNNYGFDDDKGDYRMNAEDHLAYRYHLLSSLGRGSFGQVYKAMDFKTRTPVACKVIKNKKKFHEQALVEVNVLKHLNERDPTQRHIVVRMIDHFIFRNHMVIVFELEGMSLYDLLRAGRFNPLPEESIKHFAKQLLENLVLSSKEKIVHCDLKPENVLVKRGESGTQKAIRVIDYGSSCFENERIYTYIQSRFYRAPEILLGIAYTPQIDVWSCACMLAEFANGYPLFPGENEVDQMMLIMETFGLPPKAMLDRAPRKRNFFDSLNCPRVVPNSKGKVRRVSTKRFEDFIRVPDPSGLFKDLLKGMLEYEPEKRLTPSQALRHPYFTSDGRVEAKALLPQLPSARRC